MKNLKKIPFKNQTKPNFQFDLIDYREVLSKTYDHAPTDFHIIEFFIIIFFDKGSGSHTIDFTNYKCSKGSLLTIRKDQIHKFVKGGTLKGNILLFTDAFLSSYLEEMEAQKSMLLFNELLSSPQMNLSGEDYQVIRRCMMQISEEYYKTDDEHSLSIIRSELHILITKLFRIKSKNKQIEPHKKYLREFLEFQSLAEAHTFETTRVSDYARLLARSSKTLNTITKAIVNKTAKEFVDDICTNRIKRLLINTDHSIKEIAHLAGFDESANFYKYFKRQLQTTPEMYRSQYR